jgi:hypothetical protein
MTCMVPAETSLSMAVHQHSASVLAAEVFPIAYLLLAAGTIALTVLMLHHQERFRHRFESHEVFSLRMRLIRTPTARARSRLRCKAWRPYDIPGSADIHQLRLPSFPL